MLDEDLFQMRRGISPVPMRPGVVSLLLYLARNSHRVVPHEELTEEVWRDAHVTRGSIHQAVRQARRALAEEAKLLHTVRNRGYRLEAVRAQHGSPELQPTLGSRIDAVCVEPRREPAAPDENLCPVRTRSEAPVLE